MKLTYLGTAAAEGFPAVFCNCRHCTEARRLGGKNIRTRSQALIDSSILIDLPADTYHHFLTNRIDRSRISTVFITHPHQDHFYPEELNMRHGAFAHDMLHTDLEIYCTEAVMKQITDAGGYENVKAHVIVPFETVKAENYEFTAFPARHTDNNSGVFYMIKGDGKTILYAHDTGYFYDEVFEYIEKNGIRFDLISFDCTNIDIPIPDSGHHMGIPNIERLIEKLTSIGAMNSDTVKIINHFSHNASPIHHILEERVKDKGWLVSYDSMSVEI